MPCPEMLVPVAGGKDAGLSRADWLGDGWCGWGRLSAWLASSLIVLSWGRVWAEVVGNLVFVLFLL